MYKDLIQSVCVSLCVREREREIDFVILTRAWPCIPVLEQTFLNFLGR